MVEDWDRRLVSAYLTKMFQEHLLDGMQLFPGFVMPAPTLSHQQVRSCGKGWQRLTQDCLAWPWSPDHLTPCPACPLAPQTLEYIEDALPPETPVAFGLHSNAEIGCKLREGAAFCESLQCLQPREARGEGSLSVEEQARARLEDLSERIPELLDMEDMRGRVDEFTPYIMVAIQVGSGWGSDWLCCLARHVLPAGQANRRRRPQPLPPVPRPTLRPPPPCWACPQESERMNLLVSAMRRSLAELDLGLKGDLTMSEPMEVLMLALAEDRVPDSWTAAAWPSLRPLSSWMQNLLARYQQLADWTRDLTPPPSVWLSGLFNPNAFLTAVMQTTARRNDWAIDRTVIVTEVTRRWVPLVRCLLGWGCPGRWRGNGVCCTRGPQMLAAGCSPTPFLCPLLCRFPQQIEAPSRDGAFVHGLVLEGARWDAGFSCLDDSRPKELLCEMPVILIRAVPADKADAKDIYQCPVYRTTRRFREVGALRCQRPAAACGCLLLCPDAAGSCWCPS